MPGQTLLERTQRACRVRSEIFRQISYGVVWAALGIGGQRGKTQLTELPRAQLALSFPIQSSGLSSAIWRPSPILLFL
jgi:hypothetical protein